MMYAGLHQNGSVIPFQRSVASKWEPSSLDGLVGQLASVEAVTEQSFLDLGNRIQNFHSRARDISRSAGAVLELLNGEGGEQALQRLQLLVERCTLWLNTTDEKSSEISDFAEKCLERG